MPIEVTHIAPPTGFTGEPVRAAAIKAVSKLDRKDTRVEGATSVFQVQFNLTDEANPRYWTAPNESDCDTCVAEVQTMIAETVVLSS